MFTIGLFCGFLDQIYSNVFHKVVNFEPFFLSRMPLSFPIKTPTLVNEAVCARVCLSVAQESLSGSRMLNSARFSNEVIIADL